MSNRTTAKPNVLQGTLDLMRLEQRGLFRGNWGSTGTNRKARFCAATSAGRRQLAREKDGWDRMGIIHTLVDREA